MKHKKLGFQCLVNDEFVESFRAIEFDHVRRPPKDLGWGDCHQFFKGTKENHIRCIAQKSDVEFMVKLGFVANAERLSDVNSASDSKRGLGSFKPQQRSKAG